MEVHFLGTGSCYPAPQRGASCTVLRHNSSCWMFDCGEGTQTQLMRSAIKPGRINKIFITHLHGDHLFGLPGFLCTMGQNKSDENKHVDIFGPVGLRKYVRVALEMSHSLLGYSYAVHEITEIEAPDSLDTSIVDNFTEGISDSSLHSDELLGRTIHKGPGGSWDICSEGNLHVFAAPLKHRVTCFGYVIQEDEQPGKLNAELLKTKGIPPGPLYAKIKNGESVVAPNGSLIKPEDVLGPPRPGRKIVILGDTCDSSAIAHLANSADCIVHEATHENEMKDIAVERGHSTPEMAGEFAKSIEAKQLVLTHFSQRYRNASTEETANQSDSVSVTKLIEQAKIAFCSDNVIAAEDLTFVTIHLKK